ncbi:hypothetical protein AGABI2DRAFT_197030 [Agaricus bisporus var. bisporus H97]|uniref:hypothetical protein n=1 Tax=Agaricus bisporus var. bisporus (strain H97 / ATCC MYA-4626 / FGSC 10389) TaxID=936046 RepID=UPI00029F7FE7|nr:hypothetical protein AGABI2DRAFT_197030 [Agaricus bisporus var. bisporus H97]EKV51202.1 hypothetical protein AGABI2DRAFT_197030 [Agaricus bisporus var. bisporus H97]
MCWRVGVLCWRLIAVSYLAKSTGGGGRKKLTPFNKFMQTEMQRLKEDEPDLQHKERFKLATANWKHAPENPKKVA